MTPLSDPPAWSSHGVKQGLAAQSGKNKEDPASTVLGGWQGHSAREHGEAFGPSGAVLACSDKSRPRGLATIVWTPHPAARTCQAREEKSLVELTECGGRPARCKPVRTYRRARLWRHRRVPPYQRSGLSSFRRRRGWLPGERLRHLATRAILVLDDYAVGANVEVEVWHRRRS
jgi:hypothetical protein